MNWFRSPEYEAFFDYLDQTGGFFYERWGDAPVHSLATGLLLNASQVHYFGDIGYRHMGSITCPVDGILDYEFKCSCSMVTDADREHWSYRESWLTAALNYFERQDRFQSVS